MKLILKSTVNTMTLVFCLITIFNCCDNATVPDSQPDSPGIVGDTSLPAQVQIIDLNPGDSQVNGNAINVDTSRHRIVLWAKTDMWYVQPYIATPYTLINGDGNWSSYTHPWERMVSLVVDESYQPGSVRTYHPSSDPGILAWDEEPAPEPDRIIELNGYSFRVKTAENFPAGPGPNYFSDESSNVWKDNDGLHLKISHQNGRWYCAEVIADRSYGYGTYEFQLAVNVNSFDFQTVGSGFVYESAEREIDIEFSKVLATPENAQYVIQPYSNPGNIIRFDMPEIINSSHRFLWSADSIAFISWQGFGSYPPSPDSVIQSWVYKGADIPPPGNELFRFNLWLFQGQAPVSGIGDEMIIRSFQYSALSF